MAETSVLVFFAVESEARPFRARLRESTGVRVVVSGMGESNARRAIRGVLSGTRPRLVLTCGFAGGLDSALRFGQVVFSATESGLRQALLQAGARPAGFHCARRVAVTAEEKSALRAATGKDAVEMESGIVATACEQAGVPVAVVRVILDEAGEDLPLDFNQLVDAEQNLAPWKMSLAVMKEPWKLPGLVRFGKRSQQAAGKLSALLASVLLTESGRGSAP